MKFNRLAIVIGSMKSGTTSLYQYLSCHPHICNCKIKEPGFFAIYEEWQKGIDWYESLWDYNPRDHRCAMEASTHYSKIPIYLNAPEKMVTFPYDYRFLYIVRNPIERIESHLTMGIAQGWLINNTIGDINSIPYPAVAYTRYAAQLRAYTKFFKKKDIFIIDFEDLKNQAEIVLEKICAFLELGQYQLEKEKISKIFNPSSDYPLAPPWLPKTFRHHTFKNLFFFLSNEGSFNLLRSLLWRKVGNKHRIRLNTDIKSILLEELRDDLKELSQEWGIETQKWLS